MSLVKMLRQFHFIDQNGKDQGLNVRNRSKELSDLLSDVDKIRQERKKARSNKTKYGGVEGGAGLGGDMSSSSNRYGGFGSESAATYGGSSRTVYGDGGGFGGEEADYDEDAGRSRSRGRERFDEYDEYDEGAVAASGKRKADVTRTAASTTSRTTKKAEPPKPKAPEVDLFDFGDDDVLSQPAAVPAPASNGKQAIPSISNDFGALQAGGADDDDFDDFQSAAPPATSAPIVPQPNYSSLPPPMSASSAASNTQYAAPQPRQGTQNAAFGNIFATSSPISSASTTPAPPMGSTMQPSRQTGYQAAQPNYFTSVSVPQSQPQSASGTPSIKSPIGGNKPKAAGGDAFASLLGGNMKKSNTPSKGPTIADMAKQKASAGIWGTTGTSTPSTPSYQTQSGGQKTGGAMDDLLG